MDEAGAYIIELLERIDAQEEKIRDLRVIIGKLNATLEKQQKDRNEKAELIEKLEKELTETRKRLVDTTQLFEEIRDAYTTMVGNFMTLREKYRSMETQAEVQDGKAGELEQGGLSSDLSAAHRMEG